MIRLSVCRPTSTITLAFASLCTVLSGPSASAQFRGFTPNNLVVSRSIYQGTATVPITPGQTLLPPNCPATAKCGGVNNAGIPATDSGAFPAIGSTNNVWNNDLVDGSFGITSPILIDQMTTGGLLLNTLAIDPSRIVTSFSSKSELGLKLSTDRTAVTFMGYVAPVNTLDVSNSNTPGVIDPTNPVGANVYRAVAQLDARGNLQITNTNAYSGNNGRGAILANGLYYAVGNNNNGGGTPANLVNSTGAELIVPGAPAGIPQMIGNFSITQYGYPADKAGKDNNFRGLAIFGNTLYVTKGSGSNGINTVYQVGNAGSLPTVANASQAPITVLPGFPTILAKLAAAQNPFGLCFANANTLYVADEGDGTAADAATSPNAGLQKWMFNGTTWQRLYVLQSGLNLGAPYSVPNYPTPLNPSPDGLRNIACRPNQDGTVNLWGVTSTVSANGDQGADPNQLVAITDSLANTDPNVAALERFTVLRTANYGEVLRGVALTPGTSDLIITNYKLISSTPVSAAGESFQTYRADLLNLGPALSGATATATTLNPFSVRVMPGQDTLRFPAVPADGQITSTNTFTILVNSAFPLDLNNIQWTFNTTPAGPVANPGPNQIVPVGTTVALNGSGSTNPSGVGTLTYYWAFTSRPPGSTAVLFYETTPNAMFQATAPGDYVLTLTVSNGVASNTATVTITAQ
jgi:hypothetical protein